MKVLTVIGTRPEAIKLAPVIKMLQEYACKLPDELQSFVCVTAQHRQMLDQVLKLFDIVPDYDLDIMKNMQSSTQVFAEILKHLNPIISIVRPDWVLVQGDTTTTIAAALTAFYAHTKVGYIEAGLRTYDKYQPFPEEINRRLTSVLADLYFAPTEQARQNLLDEGVPPRSIIITGNPVIDALDWLEELSLTIETRQGLEQKKLLILEKQNRNSYGAIPELENSHQSFMRNVNTLLMRGQRIVLVTAHRHENFGPPLNNICFAIKELASHYNPDIQFIYPVHLNPQVWEPVHQLLSGIPNIMLIPPLDYLSLVQLMQRCSLIITDSGGIQEEAPYFGVPIVLLRELTERMEGVNAGIVRMVGTNCKKLWCPTMSRQKHASF